MKTRGNYLKINDRKENKIKIGKTRNQTANENHVDEVETINTRININDEEEK